MGYFRDFKFFFRFNKEIVYLITIGYVALIFIIVVLCMTIRGQNRTINLLQNGIIREQHDSYNRKSRKDGLLEAEYRMFMKVDHR